MKLSYLKSKLNLKKNATNLINNDKILNRKRNNSLKFNCDIYPMYKEYSFSLKLFSYENIYRYFSFKHHTIKIDKCFLKHYGFPDSVYEIKTSSKLPRIPKSVFFCLQKL